MFLREKNKDEAWRISFTWSGGINFQSKGVGTQKNPDESIGSLSPTFDIRKFRGLCEKNIPDFGWLNVLGCRISYSILAQGTERFVVGLTVYTNQTGWSNTKRPFIVRNCVSIGVYAEKKGLLRATQSMMFRCWLIAVSLSNIMRMIIQYDR